MSFNPNDYSKAPYQAGVMTLSHDECMYVKENCAIVAEGYEPVEPWDSPEPGKTYIISHYNRIDNQEKAINGDTYDCLQGYGENTLGINESGIIQPEPEPEPTPEEPTEEPPAEEMDEPATEEETVTE